LDNKKIMNLKDCHIYNPVDIYFGRGVREKILEKLSNANILVVLSKSGKERFLHDKHLKEIQNTNRLFWIDNVESNPSLETINDNINFIKETEFDFIIGFGGGSAIDTAKAISVGIAAKKLQVSLDKIIEEPPIQNTLKVSKLIAIPTTFGTGSEVTSFATVWDKKNFKKLSLFGPKVYPTFAVVDPDLATSCPNEILLTTGLDAINQAFESIWNNNATFLSNLYATKAIDLGVNALKKLLVENNKNFLSDMAESSLLAGLAIAQTRTALCHSISYPLTAKLDIPHGLACAFSMIEVCKFNLEDDDGRLSQLKNNLGTDDLIKMLTNFLSEIKFANHFKQYCDDIQKISSLSSEMYNPSRAGNNMRNANIDDINLILKRSADHW